MTRRKFFQTRTRNYNYIDDLTSMSYGEIEKTGHFIAFFKERSNYLDGSGPDGGPTAVTPMFSGHVGVGNFPPE